ncbi:MAG: hypothetical protein KGZ63_07405, partial [Clostridiales bacterium]|nr:hypothetical protein [Clostridiales bacterium]
MARDRVNVIIYLILVPEECVIIWQVINIFQIFFISGEFNLLTKNFAYIITCIMKIIEDASVIKDILLHLDLWVVRNHGPPLGKAAKRYLPESVEIPEEPQFSDEVQFFMMVMIVTSSLLKSLGIYFLLFFVYVGGKRIANTSLWNI